VFSWSQGKIRPTFAFASRAVCAFVCNCKRQEGPTARHSSVTFDQRNLALKSGDWVGGGCLRVPVVDQDFLFPGFFTSHKLVK